MNITLTPEFETALDLLENTDKSVFITGKAGTGKSTLIEYFRDTTKKNVACVAPTGIAALNIQGRTIHSFFQLPPRLIENLEEQVGPVSRKQLEVIEKIQTIIIDEVSMVRADLLDAIDYSLRLNRGINEPFGGVQMVFVGDLYQLPPVVPNTLASYFYNIDDKYGSPWFFSSQLIRPESKGSFHESLQFIELTHIFRQDQKTQKQFIDILNGLRTNTLTDEQLGLLNTRFQIGQKPEPNELRLTVCTKNDYAAGINNRRLESLPEKEYLYEAEITGSLREKNKENYPTEPCLKLKKGAQIMMVKNDKDHRWVNGSLGKIHALTKTSVLIDINGVVCEVERETWEEIDYVYNPQAKKVTSVVVGTFTQYPVRLAWAVTIHKSQGQTFDKVTVMTQGAWEHGQVYVAVSRCRTLEGINLATPVRRVDIHTRPIVESFLATMRKQKASATRVPVEAL